MAATVATEEPITLESLRKAMEQVPVNRPVVGYVCAPEIYQAVLAQCRPENAERFLKSGLLRMHYRGELVEIHEKPGQVEPFKAFHDREVMRVYLEIKLD